MMRQTLLRTEILDFGFGFWILDFGADAGAGAGAGAVAGVQDGPEAFEGLSRGANFSAR